MIARLSIPSLIVLMILLSGCAPALSNEEIIKQTKLCEEAGMKAVSLSTAMDDSTRRIECRPIDKK